MREDPATEGTWGLNWLSGPTGFEWGGGFGNFWPLNSAQTRAGDDGGGGGFGGGAGGSGVPSTLDGDVSSFGGLLPLLGDSAEADSLGPLFRTLLALQTGKGGGKDNDLFSLFSGIQL